MRIVFFSHLDMNLYLFRLSWMTALAGAGHEVHAVVPRGEYFDRFAEHGITAVPFEMTRGSLDPVRLAGAVGRLKRLFAGMRYDIADTFTLQGSIVGASAARWAGIPTVICHVTGLGYLFTEQGLRARLLRIPTRLLARAAFSAARWVTFQNPDDRRELAGVVPERKVALIRGTGIDTVLFSPGAVDVTAMQRVRTAAGIGPETVVVSFIGRLLAHKGIAELVRAVEIVARNHPRLMLLVAGWRDEGNPAVVSREFLLRAQAGGRVRLLGKLREVRELLALTDIYVLPSYREGTPRTVLEAMAMGKPVITTDVPGCRQTVEDGVTGLLVPRGDAERLAAALERLVADAALRRRLGAAGRVMVEREFSNEVVLRDVLRLHGVPA